MPSLILLSRYSLMRGEIFVAEKRLEWPPYLQRNEALALIRLTLRRATEKCHCVFCVSKANETVDLDL